MIEYNKLDNWVADSYIITNQAIGAVVSNERHTNDSWDCMLFPVSKGDNIFIIAQGGDDPRAVAILDDEYKLIYHSDAQAKTNRMMNIEQDGFVIVNNRKSTFTTPEVLHYPFSQDNTDLGRVYTTHNHGEDTTEEYQVTIGENVYPAVKIGNQLWTAKNLDENLGTLGVDEWYYNGRSDKTRLNSKTDYSRNITATTYYGIQDNVYDWDTGEQKSMYSPAKTAGSNLHLCVEINLSSPAVSTQSFLPTIRHYDTDSSERGSYKALDRLYIPQGESYGKFDITTSVLSYLYLWQISVEGNEDNVGITVSMNVRFSYGTVDCGTNAITVPQALANEEDAKSNNYGKLYSWNNINSNLSNLGLKGWRWASSDDYNELMTIDPTGDIFSDVSAGGTNETGLSLVNTGRYDAAATSVFAGNNQMFYWSNTTASTEYIAYGLRRVNHAVTIEAFGKATGRALRLVLDLPEDGSLPDGTVRLEKTNQARNIGEGYIHDNPIDITEDVREAHPDEYIKPVAGSKYDGPIAAATWFWNIYPVKKGDAYNVTGWSDSSPRLWIFMDENQKCLSWGSQNTYYSNHKIVADRDGYVGLCSQRNRANEPYKFIFLGNESNKENYDVNEQVTLIGKYGVTKIGNQLWITENLDEELGTIGVDEWYYNGRSKSTYINRVTSTHKAISTDFTDLGLYDWNTGSICSYENPGNIAGKYFRIHGVATMDKTQLAPVNVMIRPVTPALATDFVIGTIPAGQTSITIDTSFVVSDIFITNGVGRFDFRTTRTGTGIDGTTRIDFTDIKIFSSSEAYTSTPTSTVLTIREALANEESAKSKNFGRLYTKNNIYSNFSKLNLEGWHVPSKNDLDKLFEYADNDTFKLRTNSNNWSQSTYKGTDDYGFSAEPSGYKTVKSTTNPDNIDYYGGGARFRIVASNGYDYQFEATKVAPTLGLRPDSDEVGYSVRLVLDLNEDGSYPKDATPLELRETYKPNNRNIGTGYMNYVPNAEGKVYVDDVRCDILCNHKE